jgi:hypothetical protein
LIADKIHLFAQVCGVRPNKEIGTLMRSANQSRHCNKQKEEYKEIFNTE